MDPSFLDGHEASDSESWLLNDGFHDGKDAAREAFSRGRLVGGAPDKATVGKCCGCCCAFLLLVLLGYGIFLVIVFGGVPDMHLISIVPQCKDTQTCLNAGPVIPFKAVFNARNPNRMDVRVSADIQLFKADGVSAIGDGKIRYQWLDKYSEQSNGRNKGLLNAVTATLYIKSTAVSKAWLDFFFREGGNVYSTPRLSTSVPITTLAFNPTNPTVFKMVLINTVTLYDVCFWLPTLTTDEIVVVGDPNKATAGGLGATAATRSGEPVTLADPNTFNVSPLPPSNIDAKLPWAATGIEGPALAGLPPPQSYSSMPGSYPGDYGFNLREKENSGDDTKGQDGNRPQDDNGDQADTAQRPRDARQLSP